MQQQKLKKAEQRKAQQANKASSKTAASKAAEQQSIKDQAAAIAAAAFAQGSEAESDHPPEISHPQSIKEQAAAIAAAAFGQAPAQADRQVATFNPPKPHSWLRFFSVPVKLIGDDVDSLPLPLTQLVYSPLYPSEHMACGCMTVLCASCVVECAAASPYDCFVIWKSWQYCSTTPPPPPPRLFLHAATTHSWQHNKCLYTVYLPLDITQDMASSNKP